MQVARAFAQRSTCDRAHVGCVIVSPDFQMVYGYNGALPGQPHCDDAGHLMVDGYCQRALHAEQNAIIKAARTSGVSLEEATIYTTHYPCPVCTKMLIASGIRRVFYHYAYRPDLDAISDAMMRASNVYSIIMPLEAQSELLLDLGGPRWIDPSTSPT